MTATSKIDKVLTDVRYFTHELLPKSRKSGSLDEPDIRSMFAWAVYLKKTAKANMALADAIRSHLDDDNSPIANHVEEADKALFACLLSNSRLSRDALHVAERCLADSIGFSDCDVRISAEQRDVMRKTIVATSGAVGKDGTWTKCLQMRVAAGEAEKIDFSSPETLILLASAVRVPGANCRWVDRAVAGLNATPGHEQVVQAGMDIVSSANQRGFRRGLEANPELALALLKHCSECTKDVAQAGKLARWLVCNSETVRSALREKDSISLEIASKLDAIIHTTS